MSLVVEPAALLCALGHELDSAVLAIRSGLAALEELSWRDDQGQAIVGAAIPGFDRLAAVDRELALLICAIQASAQRARTTTIGRCIVVCSSAPTRRLRLDARALAQLLLERGGVRIDSLELVIGDETTCAHVLARLRLELDAHDAPVLLCAVDSLIDTHTLAQASLQGRLRTDANIDGFAPGEAAACVWVGSRASGAASRVAGLGFAIEPATILDERPHDALGMTSAAREALAQAAWRYADLQAWVADLGGEHYEFNELALCCARLPTERCPGVDLWHPSESLGSVGVAGSVLGWILATRAGHGGWAPGRRVVCSGAAATGGRAIVLLELPAVAAPVEALDHTPRWAW